MHHAPSPAGWFLTVTTLAVLAGLPAPSARGEDPLPQIERLQSSPVLRSLEPNPTPAPPRTPAERTLAQMYVPEGFRVELVAAEPAVHQPIAFAWDERGRLWVAEAHSYPAKRPEGEGLDQIVIFEDADGDGRFETRKVFAEGLNLVSGLEVGYGGVWVGAAPQLLFLPDRDRDDQPDGPPEVLLDGFGYQDTHECLNSFLWGPDGWLYGNQGVFNTAHIGRPEAAESERVVLRAGVWRYHPVRRRFEIFAEGGSNQWGLDYDERGQLFMTHCRSYWGRGPTTHVIQGGVYWNQANANYPPFIVANPPAEFPEFRNYLLASARYGHGAGGAGPRGSDAVYGGHSHVGTMIYLGDNWPEEFRGHLFTHNLGGHQINHQRNRRLGSGFDTVHAGQDVLFCTDPTYVAVDLQYGPDGAVYFIDWSDPQHCHNPNPGRWDRASGRIYRMQWQATYQPRKVDLASLDDAKLAELHTHKNEWFVRTARRLLHERAQRRDVRPAAVATLRHWLTEAGDVTRRLRALWTLHLIGGFDAELTRRALADPEEFVRAWAVQLSAEGGAPSAEVQKDFVRMAADDPSPVVRRYLVSVTARVPDATAWDLLEALAGRAEDREDRNIPFLLWQSLAPRMPRQLDRAFTLAERTSLRSLADWIYWYAATLEGEALNRVVQRLSRVRGEDRRRLLTGLWLAMEPRANVPRPPAWNAVSEQLYASEDLRVVRLAERLASVFGEDSMFPRLRAALGDAKADRSTRQHAFAVLSRALDPASLPLFLRLLDEEAFRAPVINLLARFDAAEIPEALLQRYDRFSTAERAAALTTLTARRSFARALLDAVAAGRLPRDQLTAFHVRRLTQLQDREIDRRVAATWGRIGQTPAETLDRIARLEKIFDEAPLWAYSAREGRGHFQKLCASCHVLGGEGTRVGPELTGAGKQGVRYFLENIIDPHAVVGADFQMTTVETRSGDVISGLVINETGGALTLRTTTEEVVVPKADLLQRTPSTLSLMPEGLLDSLNEREQIELLKFLVEN